MPFKPIKHVVNPMGENAIAAVDQYLGRLVQVIKDCPVEPDDTGRGYIYVDNILKMIDACFEQYRHSLGSFYMDIRTGERVEGYTEKEFKEQKAIGY